MFAFISVLCPNRQVRSKEGLDQAAAARAGDGPVVRPVRSEEGLDQAAAARAGEAAPGIAVAAEVSLAVAAKASAENFPVALRVLPKRWRSHLTALYGFARLTDDIGDEPLPGIPSDATAAEVTAIRLKLLDELEQDVRRIYEDGEPELDAIRALKTTVKACQIQVILNALRALRG